MATSSATLPHGVTTLPERAEAITTYLVPLGRALFSAIFILASLGHFQRETIEYAASQGVPAASFLVPASGVLALVGGLSVLLGYHARIGAVLLLAFLVPVTLTMHNFWAIDDPQMRMVQQAMFMKNLAMMGGALLIAHFGPGPISLDAHREFGKTGAAR